MFEYSSDYHPTFPVLEIQISVPEAEHTASTHIALIDTGADGTFVPVSLLKELKAESVGFARVQSQWGGAKTIDIYAINLDFAEHRFESIEVIGDDSGDEIILGRNVLNRLSLTLDGISQFTIVNDKS